MTDAERLTSFAKMVQVMRRKQTRYFANGSSGDLADSKELERIIDRTLAEILEPPGLFDGEASHRHANELAAFSGVTESIRTLMKRGLLDLAEYPKLVDRIEACHQVLVEKELLARCAREQSA